MTQEQILALNDTKAILAAFKNTDPKDPVSLSDMRRFKKADPDGYAQLADDCRVHLLEVHTT